MFTVHSYLVLQSPMMGESTVVDGVQTAKLESDILTMLTNSQYLKETSHQRKS